MMTEAFSRKIDVSQVVQILSWDQRTLLSVNAKTTEKQPI